MSQPFLNLAALNNARSQQERAAFLNRHRVPALPVPLFTFVLGFALGIVVILAAL